jgi:membrane protein DedA with SNARE-associated domain
MSEAFPVVEHFPYLGILFLLFLGTLGCPFPEDTILMLSGFLISQGVVEPVPTFLVIYPTLLLTDTILYTSGRRYGRRVVVHPCFQRILSPRRLQKIETKFEKWGACVILIGRQVPGLRSQLFLASGILRLPFVKFLITDGVSALISIGSMGSMGYLGGERIHLAKQDLAAIWSLVPVFILLLTLLGGCVLYVRQKRANLRDRAGLSKPSVG